MGGFFFSNTYFYSFVGICCSFEIVHADVNCEFSIFWLCAVICFVDFPFPFRGITFSLLTVSSVKLLFVLRFGAWVPVEMWVNRGFLVSKSYSLSVYSDGGYQWPMRLQVFRSMILENELGGVRAFHSCEESFLCSTAMITIRFINGIQIGFILICLLRELNLDDIAVQLSRIFKGASN